MIKLTLKQETFCQEFVKSGNATASYKIAYPKSAFWKENTVTVKASHTLAGNDNIKARIGELRAKQAKKHDVSKDFVIKTLLDVIKQCSDTEKYDSPGINKALDTLNKMQGHYTPEKIEHSGTTIQRTITVNPTKK